MDASHTMILAEMGNRGLVPEAIVVGDAHHIDILMLLPVVTATEHKVTFFPLSTF